MTNGDDDGRGRLARMERLLENLDQRFDELDRTMVRAAAQMEERERATAASLVDVRTRLGAVEQFRQRTEARNPERVLEEFRTMQGAILDIKDAISSLRFRQSLIWWLATAVAAVAGYNLSGTTGFF